LAYGTAPSTTKTKIGATCLTWTLKDDYVFTGSDTYYRWYQSGTTHVLAFRGTKITNIDNWITNLSVNRGACTVGTGNCGELHSGFQNAYMNVQTRVLNLVKTNNPSKLIVTGHSLGGALAAIAAYDIKKRYPTKDIQIINFGSPLVGDGNFVTAFGSAGLTYEGNVNMQDTPWYSVNPNQDSITQTPLRNSMLAGKVERRATSDISALSLHDSGLYRSRIESITGTITC